MAEKRWILKMKVLIAKLPGFSNLSGLTVAVTSLYNPQILNNSGISEALINSSGDMFYANIEEDFTGWYGATVYQNGNYIADGAIKFGSASGYYLVDDPIAQYNDIYSAIQQITTNLVIPAASLPEVSELNISLFKGTTWNFNVSGIGLDASNFYFTMKPNHHITDENSTLQLNKSGTKYLNSVPQNHSSGVLSYSSSNNGTINISVNPVITSQILAGVKYVWDIKSIDSNVGIRSFGSISIKEDITDAIA